MDINTSFISQANVPTFGNAKILLKNLNRVNRDYWFNVRQDPIVLRNNALILSSFLLVVSRIFAVNRSALQAVGTSEEHHRRSEAIKTALRELGGFTFSFLSLRLIQHLAAAALRRYFGLPPEGSLMNATRGHLGQAIKASMKGEEVKPYRSFIAPGFTPPDDSTKMVERYKKLNIDRFFKKPALHLSTQKEIVRRVTANVHRIMTWLPIIIGSIPTLWLSGYFLERYTQEHANDVVERLTSKLNKQPPIDEHKSPFKIPPN